MLCSPIGWSFGDWFPFSYTMIHKMVHCVRWLMKSQSFIVVLGTGSMSQSLPGFYWWLIRRLMSSESNKVSGRGSNSGLADHCIVWRCLKPPWYASSIQVSQVVQNFTATPRQTDQAEDNRGLLTAKLSGMWREILVNPRMRFTT